MLTVGSLFSGIGGLDLGLERAGMRVIWQSEIDSYACRVLAKHWPEVPNHGDIKRVDWADVARPDVLCGGYPCQPFSLAGARKGEEDPRHLWPWVREAIRVLRPRYTILENVRGHLSLGGPAVIGEITALGYDAEWRIVSAASVGANHRRDRVIIVAYPNGGYAPNGRQRQAVSSQDRSWRDDGGGGDADSGEIAVRGTREDSSHVADRPGIGGHVGGSKQRRRTPGERQAVQSQIGTSGGTLADPISVGQPLSSSGIFAGIQQFASDGETWRTIARNWEIEPDVGRVAHGIPNRVDRLKGLGNAVVPQVAEVIGRLVMAHANANPTT
jgi:DNA (cytosine-5)-methyltransferase 1